MTIEEILAIVRPIRERLDLRKKASPSGIRPDKRAGNIDGGPGSGNWGHAGVPGQLGGSAKGSGGASNRFADKNGKFTSYAKIKHSLAKPHKTNSKELKSCPKHTKIISGNGTYTKISDTVWLHDVGGKTYQVSGIGLSMDLLGENVKIALPKEDVDVETFLKTHGVENTSGESKTASENSKNAFKTAYSNKRMSDAKKYSSKEAWNAYKDETKKILENASDSIKESLHGYTCGANFVNEPLRHMKYKDEWGLDMGIDGAKAIREITDAIEKTDGLKEDTILHRGITMDGLLKMLNIPSSMRSSAWSDPKKNLVGMQGKDDAFMSTGISNDSGNDEDVMLEIFAPAGTKGIYCAPFSNFPEEDEYLLQRGTSVKVTDAISRGSMGIIVKCCVVGQDYSDNPESKWGRYVKK